MAQTTMSRHAAQGTIRRHRPDYNLPIQSPAREPISTTSCCQCLGGFDSGGGVKSRKGERGYLLVDVVSNLCETMHYFQVVSQYRVTARIVRVARVRHNRKEPYLKRPELSDYLSISVLENTENRARKIRMVPSHEALHVAVLPR